MPDFEIVLPNLGFGMEEGRLLAWLKHPGDTVRKGEAIAEVESDKANVELEAVVDGVLDAIPDSGRTGRSGRERCWHAFGSAQHVRAFPQHRLPRMHGFHCPCETTDAASAPRQWRSASPANTGSIWRRSKAQAQTDGSPARTCRP